MSSTRSHISWPFHCYSWDIVWVSIISPPSTGNLWLAVVSVCKADFYVKSTDIFLLLCDILHLVIEGTRKKFTQIDLFNKLTYK